MTTSKINQSNIRIGILAQNYQGFHRLHKKQIKLGGWISQAMVAPPGEERGAEVSQSEAKLLAAESLTQNARGLGEAGEMVVGSSVFAPDVFRDDLTHGGTNSSGFYSGGLGLSSKPIDLVEIEQANKPKGNPNPTSFSNVNVRLPAGRVI